VVTLHPLSEALLVHVEGRRGNQHLPNCNATLRNDATKCDCRYTLAAIEAAVRADATRAAEAEVAGLRNLVWSMKSALDYQHGYTDHPGDAADCPRYPCNNVRAALAAQPAAPEAEYPGSFVGGDV